MTIIDLSARLDRDGIPHAVIGAMALAVHGVLRASDDIDLLVMDQRCLDAAMWEDLEQSGVAVEVRRGDADDPLAGVTRLHPIEGTRIDLVIGRSSWQHGILTRARRVPLLGGQVPVAVPVDLVLLKLYAGGPQDAWDVQQILDAVPGLATDVDSALVVLPKECVVLWRQIVGARSS